jgi:hypothetical protein
MAARDDSVIRGSLIACMIFLVLSLALNFMLWRWGDIAADDVRRAKEQLQNSDNALTTLGNHATLMKAMLGVGGLTQAEFDRMSESVGDDAEMTVIEDEYVKNMTILGPNVEPQNRNYGYLGTSLVKTIRGRNDDLKRAREESDQIRIDAAADIAQALKVQETEKQKAADAEKKLVDLSEQYKTDRTRINLEKEQTRDSFTKLDTEFSSFRKLASDEKRDMVRKSELLQGTIDTQKLQLNQLYSDNFETTQGEIRYVFRHGNVVTINLGSADELHPGVTFGVIDGDETRLQDAKVKATIQVTQIDGPHLAQARVIARPEVRNPIIEGDFVYSPFWAPGRKVKIALAGDIDLDGDKRPDNDAIKSMIKAAGAEVAAEVAGSGVQTGTLDASIRFLVVGEDPEIKDDEDITQVERDARSIQAIGDIKQKATELGLTIIPAWKLQNYLKTINDTVTTPLGSAARGEDFPPVPAPRASSRRPIDMPELYMRQTEGLQQGDKKSDILPP